MSVRSQTVENGVQFGRSTPVEGIAGGARTFRTIRARGDPNVERVGIEKKCVEEGHGSAFLVWDENCSSASLITHGDG